MIRQGKDNVAGEAVRNPEAAAAMIKVTLALVDPKHAGTFYLPGSNIPPGEGEAQERRNKK